MADDFSGQRHRIGKIEHSRAQVREPFTRGDRRMTGRSAEID